MTDRLKGKVAYITGAGSGIAKASAHLFSNEGAKVILADLNEETGEACAAAVRAGGGEAVFTPVNVTSPESVEASIQAGVAAFGRLDILVNCAGGSIAEDKSVTEVDLDVWDHTIGLDLKGPFLCCRFGIPHLEASGGGAIVNFTSVVALKGNFPGHVYTAAKGGIISLTQALAGKYWKKNIRANAIAPGLILSERILDRSGLDPNAPPEPQMAEAQQKMDKLFDPRHPFGVGVPNDIANIVLFLASEESRMVNGAVIPAEGGLAAY